MDCIDNAVSGDFYRKTTGAATRFERKDDPLLIYADGFD